MDIKNIMKSTFAAMAVTFGFTACADTDAQYTILDVDAPELVEVTPDANTPVLFGQKTFTVTFDKNIFFASSDAAQITLNGKPVTSAAVRGASNTLTITADAGFDKRQTLVIPAGLITGPQGKAYDKPIEVTWEIQPLTHNAATEMTQCLGWGWNLGNHFDTSGDAITHGWGYWDQATPGPALYQALAAAGAKTVRIPTTWTDHMDDAQVIAPAYLDEVAAQVEAAIAAGLNVILNTHHDSFETALADAAADEATGEANAALIKTLWTQVATHFANYSDALIFETFNEVHGGDDWSTGSEEQFALLNSWNQIAVDAIRATGGNNATRWIGVSGYAANIGMTLDHLVLPNDPANHIMVGVHSYDPYGFCTAPVDADGNEIYSSWGHNADPAKSVADANEEYIINLLYQLRTKYIENGIPCYLGEYGCVKHQTELANQFRDYYLEFFCRAANLAGIPTFIWDNNVKNSGNESFGFFDHTTGAWVDNAATLVPTMVRATTDPDDNYWFDAIWNKSPQIAE